MKSITLKERNSKTGRWLKTENYSYVELKELIYRMNLSFFNSFFFGRMRKKVVDIVFDTFYRLTEKDQEGKYPLKEKLRR